MCPDEFAFIPLEDEYCGPSILLYTRNDALRTCIEWSAAWCVAVRCGVVGWVRKASPKVYLVREKLTRPSRHESLTMKVDVSSRKQS